MRIKGILTDVDQTLFDTRTTHALRHTYPPDWDAILSKIPECQLYDGWNEVLSLLDIPIGIVTRNVKKMVNKLLKHNGLSFSPIITRYGEVRGIKRVPQPKPVLFEQALRHEGFSDLNRDEVLYLGDEVSDVIQANDFGILSGACFWGTLEPYRLQQTNPTFRLYKPTDLLTILHQN